MTKNTHSTLTAKEIAGVYMRTREENELGEALTFKH